MGRQPAFDRSDVLDKASKVFYVTGFNARLLKTSLKQQAYNLLASILLLKYQIMKKNYAITYNLNYKKSNRGYMCYWRKRMKMKKLSVMKTMFN